MSYSVACYWDVGYCVGDLPCGGTTGGGGGGGTGHGHGHGGRKRYIISGRDLLLNDDELRDALSALLFAKPTRRRGKKRPPQRVRPGQPVVPGLPAAKEKSVDPLAIVTYPAAPRFDALWGQRWVQQQAEVANTLRELAYEADLRAQDEEDVTMLLGAM